MDKLLKVPGIAVRYDGHIGCPTMKGADEENWTFSEERVVTY